MMTLMLKAYSPADGWAFLERDGTLLLLRPPYRAEDVMEVDDSVIRRAVSVEDFVSSDWECDSWHHLLSFLERQVEEYRSQRGVVTSVDVGSDFVRTVATRTDLDHIITRIEEELIPDHQLTLAIRLLSDVLANEATMDDAELGRRCLHASHKIIEEQALVDNRNREDLLLSLTERRKNLKYPHAFETYGESRIKVAADTIRRRGTVFAFATN